VPGFLFALASRAREYPDALGYGEAFGRVVAAGVLSFSVQ
jgi:hypothetical protein